MEAVGPVRGESPMREWVWFYLQREPSESLLAFLAAWSRGNLLSMEKALQLCDGEKTGRTVRHFLFIPLLLIDGVVLGKITPFDQQQRHSEARAC